MVEIQARNINKFANVSCWISMYIAILTLILPSGNNFGGPEKPDMTGILRG